MSNITLKSQRFDKNKFNETIDTKFTQLSNTLNPNYFNRDEAKQTDVFILYDMFRGIIPKFGDTESHLYIYRTSGEYANFDQNDLEVKSLLDEIKLLREENRLLLNLDNITGSIENI
tara:strand:- start:178 stop:528 length:351 start_codon:yes stop_codon:yes gene_type:complete